MPDWTDPALRVLSATQEVQVATRRRDDTLSKPRIVWLVTSGRRVFIRSTNGVTAAWYRGAIATGAGQLTARGTAYEVTFTHVDDEAGLAVADAGYRAKYGRYASIVDHLEEAAPRAATLELHLV